MKCPNCQNNLPDGAVFCNVCGGSITAAAPQTTVIPHPLAAEAAGRGFTPPDGFTLDPVSGLYYITTPGQNPETGEDGQWTTWFYPDSGEYVQQFHPAALVADSAPSQSQAVPKKKGKISPLLIALPLAALVVGIGIAFVTGGGLELFQRDEPGAVMSDSDGTLTVAAGPEDPVSPMDPDTSSAESSLAEPNPTEPDLGEPGASGSSQEAPDNSLETPPPYITDDPTQSNPADPDPHQEPDPPPEIRNPHDYITAIYASSWLSPQTGSDGATRYYSPENMLDGDDGTVWSEGADGNGIDETIIIEFSEDVWVAGISIKNGYWSTENLYNNNGRVKVLFIGAAGGTMEEHTLPDLSYSRRTVDVIMFDEPRYTRNIEIIIFDVYPGARWSDTCINEIQVIGIE